MSGNPNSGIQDILLVESRIIREFVLVELEILELGIRNLAQEIRNPSSTNKESEIYCLESGIHSMESRIQDCLAFPYIM